MLVALVSVIGGLFVSPAFADDGHDQQGRHGDHGHRDHGNRGDRGWHGDHRDYEYRRYGYAQPVYAPPPVYYEPQQSSGISFFFPLDFRR